MAASDIEEEPLDPQVEAIRRKMIRLLFVSGGIMFIGLMTVLIAIVYKINQGTEAATAAIVTKGEIILPTGTEILDTALDGNDIMLTLKNPDGSKTIRIYRNGAAKTEFAIK